MLLQHLSSSARSLSQTGIGGAFALPGAHTARRAADTRDDTTTQTNDGAAAGPLLIRAKTALTLSQPSLSLSHTPYMQQSPQPTHKPATAGASTARSRDACSKSNPPPMRPAGHTGRAQRTQPQPGRCATQAPRGAPPPRLLPCMHDDRQKDTLTPRSTPAARSKRASGWSGNQERIIQPAQSTT